MQCRTEFDKREKMSWWGRLAEKQVQWIKIIPHWLENNAANFYRVSPSNTEPNSKPHHQHHQDIGFFPRISSNLLPSFGLLKEKS